MSVLSGTACQQGLCLGPIDLLLWKQGCGSSWLYWLPSSKCIHGVPSRCSTHPESLHEHPSASIPHSIYVPLPCARLQWHWGPALPGLPQVPGKMYLYIILCIGPGLSRPTNFLGPQMTFECHTSVFGTFYSCTVPTLAAANPTSCMWSRANVVSHHSSAWVTPPKTRSVTSSFTREVQVTRREVRGFSPSIQEF